ncbi:MAG: iron-containing alcohol dehydrogenase [Magnetococcales bacterium]|nr:iron-containing alcohol dehydrogenase [Magnetococcales bacterium]MBF0631369.1 iron-containing alcohol dehydrogenase [Magnetococcales bacterium]
MGCSRIKTVFPVPRLLASPDLFAGSRALMALKGMGSSRTLLLTGGSLRPELRAEIKKMLSADSVLEVVRSGQGDPDWDGVERVLSALGGNVPDLIVAVGGGAVMDLAKLLLLRLAWPEAEPGRMYRPFAVPPLKNQIRLCAIPTTAGSGAEVSSSALVMDRQTGTKMAVVTHDFLCDVVLLDPRFLLGIPRRVMMAGVIDAMTHAVEGTISNVDNPLADALAETALERLGRLGRRWLEDERDMETILQLQLAAHWAGMVQNQCGVGICHSLAHQLAPLGIGHGEANGVFLAPVLEFNRAEAKVAHRLDRLESLVGFAIAERLREFQRAGGLAVTFGELVGVRGDVHAMARHALADICTRFNPREVTWETLVPFYL